MAERATGIKTGTDEYVATFEAAEQAEGKTRVVQIIGITAGKIDATIGSADRTVSTNDSFDVSTVSGNVISGDNSYMACYVKHSQSNGSCLITPLLCDNDGSVVGSLEPKQSKVNIPIQDGADYLSNCLSWTILDTGAHKLYPHVCGLSDSNQVSIWVYTF